MSIRLKNDRQLGSLALLLVVVLGASHRVEADEPKPLEYIATIQLKG